jgi:hypothetical protein
VGLGSYLSQVARLTTVAGKCQGDASALSNP